jgi:hypothetical protein
MPPKVEAGHPVACGIEAREDVRVAPNVFAESMDDEYISRTLALGISSNEVKRCTVGAADRLGFHVRLHGCLQ